MLKTIDVVAAIIEQNGKILLAQRPAHADQAGMWELAGGKVEQGESQPQALIRELREELGIIAQPTRYIASHQREVSGRIIHLHAWHVPVYEGEIVATNIARSRGASRMKHSVMSLRLPMSHCLRHLSLYATPDKRVGAEGFLVTQAL